MDHSSPRQWFYRELSEYYLQGELQSLYHWCVAEIHGWSRTEAYLKNEEAVSEEDRSQWESVVQRLKNSEPIQYIFNKVHFHGLKLYVDDRVLIPRPETEELVDIILSKHDQSSLRVLDIGTGSGAIALALKNVRPDWQVHAVDVSQDALHVAMKNAAELELDVKFNNMNILEQDLIDAFDLIVSNPPYIPESLSNTLDKRVVEFEPNLALFSPEADPFIFFKRIASLAQDAGVKDVYFETHAEQTELLKDALSQIWKGEMRGLKDLSSKERFLHLSC